MVPPMVTAGHSQQISRPQADSTPRARNREKTQVTRRETNTNFMIDWRRGDGVLDKETKVESSILFASSYVFTSLP